MWRGQPDVGGGTNAIALRHHVARAAFALAALCCHTQLELNFVKAHASVCMASDVAIRNSAADANDHGTTIMDKVEDLTIYDVSINENVSHYQ